MNEKEKNKLGLILVFVLVLPLAIGRAFLRWAKGERDQ